MASNCPLTCQLCTPVPTTKTTLYPCSDKSWIPNTPPSCSAFAGLCNIQIFQAIMTQYCPKTCGFCSSTPPLGTTTAIPGGR
uniref:ShKT domain-containing protein n=1 Tax=Acrobeloides nanus TaxID=290746 RepID=A0A914DGK9_9BILA